MNFELFCPPTGPPTGPPVQLSSCPQTGHTLVIEGMPRGPALKINEGNPTDIDIKKKKSDQIYDLYIIYPITPPTLKQMGMYYIVLYY